MKIAERNIDLEHPPYVIAELGVNHDGDSQLAIDLVEASHRAGADAIKLQYFKTEHLLSRAAQIAAYQKDSGADDPFEMLRGLEMDLEQMKPIVDHAKSLGLHAIVSLFSQEEVAEASTLDWDAYKTASPDLINLPLIEAIGALDRPMILSTGTATLDEVKRAATWLKDRPHVMLHCVSSYPTPEEDAALGGIPAMIQALSETDDSKAPLVGYSDHTTSLDTGALAVMAGACMLEKHLTYDRLAPGPDHSASLDPEAFASYVHHVHRAYKMRGPIAKRVLEVEQDVRNVSRQSLVAMSPLMAGHVLRREDLTIKRPGVGLEPHFLATVIGQTLTRDVEADMPLVPEDLS